MLHSYSKFNLWTHSKNVCWLRYWLDKVKTMWLREFASRCDTLLKEKTNKIESRPIGFSIWCSIWIQPAKILHCSHLQPKLLQVVSVQLVRWEDNHNQVVKACRITLMEMRMTVVKKNVMNRLTWNAMMIWSHNVVWTPKYKGTSTKKVTSN